MKKLKLLKLICVICIATALCTPITANDGTDVHLEEVGLSLTIPSDYEVFTRGVSANDPRFAELGIDGNAMVELFSGYMYLSAVEQDFSSEITVTMGPNYIYKDYNLLGQTTVKTMVESITKDMFEANGIDLIDYSIYQHNQALFIEYHYKDSVSSAYALQYSTIYDSKDINITCWSYDGDVTQADRDFAKSIVDGVIFDTEPQKPESAPSTSAFVYKDNETAVSFTVPANWERQELSQEREFVDASFASLKDKTVTILYGSTDLWERATEDMKQGFSRSDLTMSAFTKDDIALMNGVASNQVRAVVHNGITYYQTDLSGTHNMYGVDWFIEVTQLTYIDNGWIYQFQFSGTEKSEFYSDFISLINSVTFPVQDVSNNVSNNIINDIQEDPFDLDMSSIVLSLIITITIYAVPVVIYRYAVRKRPMEPRSAKIFTIVYAIIGFIIMSIVTIAINGNVATGGGLLLWSFINYKILTGGRKKAVRKRMMRYTLPCSAITAMSMKIKLFFKIIAK